MMKNDLFNGWGFLLEHKIFNVQSSVKKADLPEVLASGFKDDVITSRVSYFERGLGINVVMVNPETMEIDLEDDALNTKQMVWLEASTPMMIDGEVVIGREFDLYGSGETFEKAVEALVGRVKELCGDDVQSSGLELPLIG